MITPRVLICCFVALGVSSCTQIEVKVGNAYAANNSVQRSDGEYLEFEHNQKRFAFPPKTYAKPGDVICSIPDCSSKLRLKSIEEEENSAAATGIYSLVSVGLIRKYEFEETSPDAPVTDYKTRADFSAGSPSNSAGTATTGSNAGNTPPKTVAP